MAAAEAIAKLAREPVPKEVSEAYNNRVFKFGRDYIIPTPFDPRLIHVVSKAVAKAAIETGVARVQIDDWQAYEDQLRRMGAQLTHNHNHHHDHAPAENHLHSQPTNKKHDGFPKL